MNKLIKPFLYKTLIITWLLELASGGIYYSFQNKFSLLIMIIPIYFFAVYFLFHYLLLKASEMRQAIFISKYMMFTGLKLFLNIGVLIAIILLNKEFAINNAISFLICFFIFTFFEVQELLKIVSKK